MKKFQINYCDKGNTSELQTVDTLGEAIKFADDYVSDYEKVDEGVDPDTDVADIFRLQVWSYDDATEDDPGLEYETPYYYSR